ncbi:MAG: D-alanine--D-alanine ligase [Patescibacteria group bacterium]|nr:D-alanine--D-alanine ligase [Patescibacteria group bacterium]MCL5262054.1 D-alanine--D-alanine ligase [Patescibacteria group bacterium]
MLIKKRIAVLMGGPSSEHDVSLSSGKTVAKFLDRRKYEVFPVIIDRRGRWGTEAHELKELVDLAFIAMHGEYGEDGTIQMILEEAGLPYTGSGPASSALGMNKILSERVFKTAGLNTPESISIQHLGDLKNLRIDLDWPVVVKPADKGSSVGVAVVRNPDELYPALEQAFAFSRNIMIQEFIKGRELTCGVIDDGLENSRALAPTEIAPKTSDFFDYDAKYVPGASEETTPARLPIDFIQLIQKTALAAHRAIGASGFSRTDMILSPYGKLYILEVNTIPGMTPTSLLPQGAWASGLNFPEFLDNIIQAAFRKHGISD